MAATIDYGLPERGLYTVDVRLTMAFGLNGSDPPEAFLTSESAQGSYYVALIYVGFSSPNKYRYHFTDYHTALDFKLRFG